MDRIPEEVLRQIFMIGYTQNSRMVDHYLGIILGVSRRWRQVISELLEVWSTIMVSEKSSQLSPRFIETCLNLSRDQPLSIYISLADFSTQVAYLHKVLPLLLPHMQRWRVFELWHPFAVGLIDEYAGFHGVAPHLECLDVNYIPEPNDRVVTAFPLDIYAPNLEMLLISCPPAWYYDFPARFTNLKNLVLAHQIATNNCTISFFPIARGLLSTACSFQDRGCHLRDIRRRCPAPSS